MRLYAWFLSGRNRWPANTRTNEASTHDQRVLAAFARDRRGLGLLWGRRELRALLLQPLALLLDILLHRRRAGLLCRHPGVELGIALLVDLPLFSQRDDLLPREGKLYTCVPVHSWIGTGTGRCNMYL